MREVGAIDLQYEAGFGDRFVFVPHGIGDGVNIALEVLVMIVAKKQRHHAGRGRTHETAGGLDLLQRRLEVVGVGLRRLLVAHSDRGIAGRRLAARAARIAEYALFQTRKVGEVLIDEGIAGAAKAIEPILDVGGVARLRHFAVVDQINARISLFFDHLGDRGFHARSERDSVDRYAFLPWRTSCG